MLVVFLGCVTAPVHAGGTTSSIVLTPDERAVCSVNQDSDSVTVWRRADDGATTEIPVGDEPRTLAVSPDGAWLVVTSQRSQTLTLIELATRKARATIPLAGQPYGVVIDRDGRRAFVSQYAGDYIDGVYAPGVVAVLDLSTRKVTHRIPTKPRPWAMTFGKDDAALYVTHYLHVNGKGIVTEIDPSTKSVRREFELREDKIGGGQAGVFNGLTSIVMHPRQPRLLVAGMQANTNRGHVLSGEPLTHKTTVQAATRIIDIQAGTELFDARILSSFAGLPVAVPSALAFVDDEHFIDLYFASNDFKVIRYNEKGYVAERAILRVPDGPTGVAVTRDGKTAFIASRWDRSITQVCLAELRQPQPVKTIRTTRETWSARRIHGARLFHDTRDTRMTGFRWASCGACHLDGGEISDGVLWDLTMAGAQRKVSNTMDLVLTSGSSPPFFHRGTPDVVGALERFVEVFQGGSGYLDQSKSTDEWQAILTYVSLLRARPNPHLVDGEPRPEIRAAAARGRKVYWDEEVACGQCHHGAYLTESGLSAEPKLYDVGTGKRLDVPSLLHLWDTAPYLHDGRAATLDEVFTMHNPDDKHGKTSHLSTRQIDDLVTYLLAPKR